MEQRTFEYYAFISYSRLDEKWAKWIQHKLETYRFPVTLRKNNKDLPKKIFPVFRDKTDLVSGELWESLKHQLEESEYLIVICSPNSAKAEWVNNEVAYFRSLGRNDKIIPLIVDGSPHAADAQQECFCPVLRDSGEDELLGVSIKELGQKKALLRVISGMMRLRFDSLVRREKIRMRRRIGTAFVAVVFAACAVFFTFRMTLDPERAASAAEHAVASLEQKNYMKAVAQGKESVSHLWKKNDTDPGVVTLKSALATQQFAESTSYIREAFSVSIGNERSYWFGCATDNSSFMLYDYSFVMEYDNKTGELLGRYGNSPSAPEEDKAYLCERLGITEEERSEIDNGLNIDPAKRKRTDEQKHELVFEGKTLFVKDGEKTISSFNNVKENSFLYCFNAEETVIALCNKNGHGVLVKNMDIGFSATYDAEQDVEITNIKLSPKGRYLFLSCKETNGKQVETRVYDVTLGLVVKTFTDFGSLILEHSFDGFFYWNYLNKTTKYEYEDITPEETVTAYNIKRNYPEKKLSPDGEICFVRDSSTDGTFYYFFEAKTGKIVLRIIFTDVLGYGRETAKVSVDPMMTLCVIAFGDRMEVWDIRHSEIVFTEETCYECTAMDESAERFVAANPQGNLFLYRSVDGKWEKNELTSLGGQPFFVLIGDRYVAAGLESALCLYDLETQELFKDEEVWYTIIDSNIPSERLRDGILYLNSYVDSSLITYDIENRKRPDIDALEDWTVCGDLLCGSLFTNNDMANNEIIVFRCQNDQLQKLYSYMAPEVAIRSFDSSGKYLILNMSEADGEDRCQSIILEAETGNVLMEIPYYNVLIAGERLYSTNIPYVPVKLPSATLYSTEEIAAIAKQKD